MSGRGVSDRAVCALRVCTVSVLRCLGCAWERGAGFFACRCVRLCRVCDVSGVRVCEDLDSSHSRTTLSRSRLGWLLGWL